MSFVILLIIENVLLIIAILILLIIIAIYSCLPNEYLNIFCTHRVQFCGPFLQILNLFSDSFIEKQNTPISGHPVRTIERCASQMRAVARKVFILRGVCSVIKRTGERRQRVFHRCGKPPQEERR